MVTKKSIKIDTLNISYVDEGEQGAPPVLLIHGVPESSMLWKHLIPGIVSQGFRTIAPDLPGFGQSDRFQTESSWANYVKFINRFTEELKLEKVHLIVHDWGGLIGLRWACDHIEKIGSLIISDSSFIPGYRWHPIARKWRTPEVGEQVMETMADKEQWFTNMKKEVPPIDEEVLEDFYSIYQTEDSRRVILDLYRSASPELLEPYQKLSAIKSPVTILWGENDPYIHYEFAYKMRDLQYPHAAVHIIPDAGHFIHIEAPQKVVPLVDEHFQTVKNNEQKMIQ
ncbi:alpha/beta hydrolase [Neobacillus sp. FSL H8-0543]|uniref:alpha/beta fold hydrolase n=1 Tax=Neobacillus sp. FSL H8-0543 TaxID=2954672 RepID=UPI00315911B2